jgi:hypothetical protein
VAGKFSPLKRSTVIFLALLILLQSFSKLWIIYSFQINQDYIASMLCINRDKPEKACNGQCVLMQRIMAQEEQQKRDCSALLKSHQEALFVAPILFFQLNQYHSFIHHAASCFAYLSSFRSGYLMRVFHPPNLLTA